MSENDYDPVELVLEIRRRLSAELGNDFRRMGEYFREVQKTMPNPIYRRPEPESPEKKPNPAG
jgi:hypothetical protein